MNTTDNTTIVPMEYSKNPQVWYLTPSSKSVLQIRLNTDEKGNLSKVIKTRLRCEYFDVQCFQTDPHTRYTIWFNDVGAYANEPYNPVAQKILSKINLNWGERVLTGWYVVTKEEQDPAYWDPEKITDEMEQNHRDYGWNYVDMDITDIRKWIADINIVCRQRYENMRAMFKEYPDMKVISV
jgi:hypothetical protein